MYLLYNKKKTLGNADALGVDLLKSLIKMAPTKEEEGKLKDIKDELTFKLGPAEKFLKAVVDIPFAFKRVDAMLYIACFGSEVEYLKGSFKTLEVNYVFQLLVCHILEPASHLPCILK